MFEVFPEINRPHESNPDANFDLYVDSHADHRWAHAIWYNQKSRNEVRITRLGGAQSALLDPDSTDALAIFSLRSTLGRPRRECPVWARVSHAALTSQALFPYGFSRGG